MRTPRAGAQPGHRPARDQGAPPDTPARPGTPARPDDGPATRPGRVPRGRPLLDIRDLTVTAGPGLRLVDQVDLSIAAGETLGIVGESGSGKSITCLAAMGLLPRGARVTGGSVTFAGQDLRHLGRGQLSRIRGRRIGMIFQEPLSSLDPAFTIGDQIVEVLRRHLSLTRRQARARALDLLDLVKIPAPRQRLASFPHELSGGMAQRALIAMAIACEPELLIADEPTTALDVTVQLQILDLLTGLREALGMALLLISHDLGVVGTVAERLAVMYAGQVVESGTRAELFTTPRHPYTSALLSASVDAVPKGHPLPVIPGQVPAPGTGPAASCRFANRCAHATAGCRQESPQWTTIGSGDGVRCSRQAELSLPGVRTAGPTGTADVVDEPTSAESAGAPKPDAAPPVLSTQALSRHFTVRRGSVGLRRAVVHAVDGIDLTLPRGHILGLVGESGSGKSTVGRLALRLIEPTGGQVRFLGDDLAALRRGELRARRRGMQMVFQDPFASLDPMMTVGQSIAEPLAVHGAMSAAERSRRVGVLLERVGLDPALAGRPPRTLSGGQRQRVAFARALALGPQLIVCDEPVSALDVSTRSQVVNLVRELRDADGIAFLFIAHDLALVHHVSDEIAVMYLGRVVETGPASRVYQQPAHPYTQALLASVLTTGTAGRRPEMVVRGEVPSPIDPPSGCRFRTRCPYASDICAAVVPTPTPVPGGGWSACHLHRSPPPEGPRRHPDGLRRHPDGL